MKLKKPLKTSVKKLGSASDNIVGEGDNLLENVLEKELDSLYKEYHALEAKIKSVKKHLLEARILPFKLGDDVLYTTTDTRGNDKFIRGILEYNEGIDYLSIRPFKNDGKLSQRTLNVYTPMSKDYSDVLTSTKAGD